MRRSRIWKATAQIFDAGINAIPGVWSMPLAATYLAWVDFSGTGMAYDEISRPDPRRCPDRRHPGPSFGTGGETFHALQSGHPPHMVEEAVQRMQKAFGDLQ